MVNAVLGVSRKSALLNQSEDSQNPTTQKTSETALQTMQSASPATENGNPHLFTRLAEIGPLEHLLSYLPIQDIIRCAAVDQRMAGMKKRDLTCGSAFTEQLEWRSQNAFPITYREHQQCHRFGLRLQPSTMSHADLVKELDRRNQSGIQITHAEHLEFVRMGLDCRLTEHIHHLDLSGASISDDELEQIIRLYPNLRTLNLTRSMISDRGFELLKKLPLEELNLSECHGILRFDFETGFPSLKRLNLTLTQITDIGLASLVGCPSLTSLSLERCVSIQSSGLEALANAGTPLTELNLARNFHLPNDAYAALAGFPHLRHLSLSGTSIVDADLAHLEGLRIMHLDLSYNRMISDQGIRSIRRLPLESLILDECSGIGDLGFVSLRRMPLKTLSLEGCKITDSGLAVLAKALPLRSLNLKNCDKLTDDGISSLVPLPLETLKLDRCIGIGEEGFNALAELPLRSLSVADSRITEKSLRTLAEKMSLTSLNISHCPNLENAPLINSLRLLPLKRLVTTDLGLASLRQEIPGLQILFI